MNHFPCPAFEEEEELAAVHPDNMAALENDRELVDAVAKYAHVDSTLVAIEAFHDTVRIEVIF